MGNHGVTIIGPAIIDVLAGPIGANIFKIGTMPMKNIKMSFGGNAYNEAAILRHLNVPVNLISKVGNDETGNRLIDKLESLGINNNHTIREDGIDTSINIVLFDEVGERRFLTNPQGSQRCLSEKDIWDALDSCDDIVSFSCMFISPLLSIQSMTKIFKKIKEKPSRILVVDMTKAKNGEKIKDLEPMLRYVDYILPNEEELKILSHNNIDQGANELLDRGTKCVIVKQGKQGCLVYHKGEKFRVETFTSQHVIDTTGAGDAFAAGLLYGLFHKMDLIECIQMANATASCCVEYVGATEGIVSLVEPLRRYEVLRNKLMETCRHER